MGMIGVAAGWGQRLGTRHGLYVRNQMLRWALYTIIYGYVLAADNVAHAVGFFAGTMIGYVAPVRSARTLTPLGDWLLTLCGTVMVMGAVTIILVRPASLTPFWSNDRLTYYEDAEQEGDAPP